MRLGAEDVVCARGMGGEGVHYHLHEVVPLVGVQLTEDVEKRHAAVARLAPPYKEGVKGSVGATVKRSARGSEGTHGPN